ncbi:hypothetical protein [Hyphomicrobium sp. 99]|uniref:hypothetical protein n=1 Tax=Hyphomicrobium sp. 99 TaxID=1163419 RepID=UPI0012E02BB4|nr:hypothetical protein [Hyphomicrobium sp. 99]
MRGHHLATCAITMIGCAESLARRAAIGFIAQMVGVFPTSVAVAFYLSAAAV